MSADKPLGPEDTPDPTQATDDDLRLAVNAIGSKARYGGLLSCALAGIEAERARVADELDSARVKLAEATERIEAMDDQLNRLAEWNSNQARRLAAVEAERDELHRLREADRATIGPIHDAVLAERAARLAAEAERDERDAVNEDHDDLLIELVQTQRKLRAAEARLATAKVDALNEAADAQYVGSITVRAFQAWLRRRAKALAVVPQPEPRPQRRQLSRETLLYEAEHMGVEAAIDAALDLTKPYEVPRWDEDRIVIENGWLDGRCGRCGEALPVGVPQEQAPTNE